MGTRLRVMVGGVVAAARRSCWSRSRPRRRTAVAATAVAAQRRRQCGGERPGGDRHLRRGDTGSNVAAESDPSVLKLGWAQDPKTLNPFVGQDEEDFTVWAINWDLLVNFSPKDLTPAPGIAEELGRLRRQEDGHLPPRSRARSGPTASRSPPRTSSTRSSCSAATASLFTSYTSNVTSIDTPDDRDGRDPHQAARRADRRRPVHLHPARAHLGQGAAQGAHRLLPADAAARRQRAVRRHRLPARPDHHDGAQPELPRAEPEFDEIQFIKYGNQDAVERALQLGEIDLVPEVEAAELRAARHAGGHRDEPQPHRPPSRSSPSTSARSRTARTRSSTRRSRTATVRQAIAYAVDRERDQRDRVARHLVRRPRAPARPTTRRSTSSPSRTTRSTPTRPTRCSTTPAGSTSGDGVREKGGEKLSFDLYVRSESPSNIQAAKLIAEMTKDIGVEFKVQVVSTDKLYDLTTRKIDGKPAPDFDTFIWGWGGDPYDPSFLLSILTTGEIGGSSDSFYSNPEYDQLYQASRPATFDTARAQGDDPADGRDHPARPALPGAHRGPAAAGLPDRPHRARSSRSARRRPATCSATRSPTSRCWRSTPVERRLDGDDGIGNAGLAGRRRPRRRVHRRRHRHPAAAAAAAEREPLELPENERAGRERPLARRQGRPAAMLTLIFVLDLQLLPVPGDRRPDRRSSPGCRGATAEEIEQLRADYGLDKPLLGQFADYAGDTARLDLGISQQHPRAGLGRDQGGDPVDAAAGRHRHPAGDPDRRLDGGDGRDQARHQDRRRPARLQPVHLRRARVLDRDHPDPRLRGRDRRSSRPASR